MASDTPEPSEAPRDPVTQVCVLLADAPDAAARAAAHLLAGHLLGLPTETVYGLAADADQPAAVARIFQAKGRPADHPLIVHLADTDAPGAASQFASTVPPFAAQLMQAFWPGPLTLILPRRPERAAAAAGGQAAIGLRCPDHPAAQAVLRACAQLGVLGLAAPSANRFGRVSPTRAEHVASEFAQGQASPLLVLDGGPCRVGIESTIVDCTRGVPVLLRPGAISSAQMEAVTGERVRTANELAPSNPRASGTLAAHYAPNARVRLMEAQAMQTGLDMLAGELERAGPQPPRIAVYARSLLYVRTSQVLQRRMPDDAAATAQQLFAVLREFDAQGVRLIWVETPPAGADWDGVRDRLSRAASAP